VKKGHESWGDAALAPGWYNPRRWRFNYGSQGDPRGRSFSRDAARAGFLESGMVQRPAWFSVRHGSASGTIQSPAQFSVRHDSESGAIQRPARIEVYAA